MASIASILASVSSLAASAVAWARDWWAKKQAAPLVTAETAAQTAELQERAKAAVEKAKKGDARDFQAGVAE